MLRFVNLCDPRVETYFLENEETHNYICNTNGQWLKHRYKQKFTKYLRLQINLYI